MPYALCQIVPHVTEKGYSCSNNRLKVKQEVSKLKKTEYQYSRIFKEVGDLTEDNLTFN